jgi:hypothetical protein
MAATKPHYGINFEKPYHKEEQTTQISRNAIQQERQRCQHPNIQ